MTSLKNIAFCCLFIFTHLLIGNYSVIAAEDVIDRSDNAKQFINSREFKNYFPDFIKGLLREDRSALTYRKKLEPRKPTTETKKLHEKLDLLVNNYDSAVDHIKKSLVDNSHPSIPRIIHQIWLGKEVPKYFKAWMKTWMNWSGWEYILWTDKEVAELTLINQDLYDRAVNYGEKSDILRLELLHMIGGVYVDVDFNSVSPEFFDALHSTVDFYAGVEPLEHEFLRIGNSLIGSAPGHPLLAKMIEQLPKNYNKEIKNGTLTRTGPRFVSRMIYDYLENPSETHTVNIVMPSVTFYPYSGQDLYRQNVGNIGPLKSSAAIHFWSGSWSM